jgi:uncharacterized membrane protein
LLLASRTFGLAGLFIGVRVLLAVFVYLILITILVMPPCLVPLQEVLVTKGKTASFDNTDEITPA